MTLGPDRKTRARWARLHGLESRPLRPRVLGRRSSQEDDDEEDDEDDDDEEDEDDEDSEDDSEDDDEDDDSEDDSDDDSEDDDDDEEDDDRSARDKRRGSSKSKVKVQVIDGKRYVLQDDVNRLTGDARKEGRDAERRRLEAEEQDRKDLSDKKFRKILKRRDAEITRLRAETETRDIQALRRKVAKDVGIPEDMADRLTGKDESELRKDAKALKKFVGARQAPETQTSPDRKGRKAGTGTKTPPKTYRFQQPGDIIRDE